MSLKRIYGSSVYINDCAYTQPHIFLQKGITFTDHALDLRLEMRFQD